VAQNDVPDSLFQIMMSPYAAAAVMSKEQTTDQDERRAD
jgi:hypothetical protein